MPWSGGLATSTWAISGHALWTHGPAQLVLVGAMLARGAGRHARSGLLMGASILVRPHPAVVPAMHTGWTRRQWRPVAVVGATASLGLLAPSRGLLTISPFLIPLVPGLPAAWRRAPDWVRAAALGGVVYLLLQLRANPAFGAGFGFVVYRIQLEALTLAAPPLVLAWRHWTRLTALRRRAFWTLAGVSVAVQALAVSVDLPPSPPSLGGQIGWGLTEWRWVWNALGWWVPAGLLVGAGAGLALGSVPGRKEADDRR